VDGYGEPQFDIAGRGIGDPHPAYVIAEVGANHDRDLQTARELIDGAAAAGADAVKFQTYTADELYSRSTPSISYLEESGVIQPGESVHDLIARIELPWEWHAELVARAQKNGITFLSTPFDETAVDVLEEVGVPAFKIASYEITHLELIRKAALTSKPLILSTAMASLGEIEDALVAARGAGATRIALMHCAVNYPPRFEDLNLRAIGTLRTAFGVPIGWSDHTLGHTADVVAIALGARLIEKHITVSRDRVGPDHGFALTIPEFGSMVEAVRQAEASLGSPIKRATPAEEELRTLARRSVVARRAIAQGTRIVREDLAIKRPGTGITPSDAEIVIGLVAARAIAEDEVITWDALKDQP
jgi:sialic acid synthase SpsE